MDPQKVIRKHIATEIANRISAGQIVIITRDFADFHNRLINPATMRRYMIGEPLFNSTSYQGDTYPRFLFIWAPRELLNIRPAIDWLSVLRECFTPEILNHWMYLSTKHTRTLTDPFVVTHQVMLFKNILVPLRYATSKVPTNEKIDLVTNAIKSFWNVAYGHK